MADDEDARRKRIREAILQHLRAHPFAADTAKGIVLNWLPRQGFEDAADHIGAALAQLVAKGRLRVRPLPDGEVLYAANPRPTRKSESSN